MTVTSTERAKSQRIPPPSGAREALKANVFNCLQFSNTQLQPLFPYYGDGAMVPCVAVFRGTQDPFGHFFHWNTADEVLLVLAGKGSLVQTGHLHATPNLHGVNSFLKDPTDDSSFMVASITQRQSIHGPQREAVLFRCEKCHDLLVTHEYDATPPEDRPPDGGYHDFVTIIESARAADLLNASEAARTCGKCGHQSAAFPTDPWGWHQATRQLETVNMARRAMLEAAEQHHRGEA